MATFIQDTAIPKAEPNTAITSTVHLPHDFHLDYHLEGSPDPQSPVLLFSNELLTTFHIWDPTIKRLKQRLPHFRFLRYSTFPLALALPLTPRKKHKSPYLTNPRHSRLRHPHNSQNDNPLNPNIRHKRPPLPPKNFNPPFPRRRRLRRPHSPRFRFHPPESTPQLCRLQLRASKQSRTPRALGCAAGLRREVRYGRHSGRQSRGTLVHRR